MARRSGAREEGLGGSGAGGGVHRGRIRNIQGIFLCVCLRYDFITTEAPCILTFTPHPYFEGYTYSIWNNLWLLVTTNGKRKQFFVCATGTELFSLEKFFISGPIFLFKITNCSPIVLCVGAASVWLRPGEGGVPAPDPPAGGPPLPWDPARRTDGFWGHGGSFHTGGRPTTSHSSRPFKGKAFYLSIYKNLFSPEILFSYLAVLFLPLGNFFLPT